MHAAVVAEDGEAAKVGAVRARDVKLVRKVADADVVRVVVLVLHRAVVSDQPEERGGRTHLKVLSRDLDLVELLVLELDEPVADALEVRLLGALVEERFVAVAPGLEALDVVAEGRLGREEVLLELRLRRYVVSRGAGAKAQAENAP